ncbi:10708_t:CDS:2 [Funneliformis geosporum]|uniref:10708_t:CDS:1 n=1 Tax=Funneliformis geosporum TaxID=1117311 RepID=A0A9W4SAY4_9GLOM|nr:10708_t:CDS:2 [Funneliformis geosporum]
MGKQKIISAIKTFRNEVNNKLLPGKDREKITAFNKRVENVIEKLSSDNFEDFREEGQIKIIRLKLETCIEGLEATISEKKTTNIIENEAKNILNSNGFNYFDNPEQEKKSKKLASVFLIREIIKDFELSNLPPARGKELENLLFAATIRDFSFDPQSKQLEFKFFDNKNEILELSEKIGSILTSSRPLIEGEYDEDIEEITYENGTKNFAQIKLEIEQKLASEKNQNPPKNFTEFSQEAEQEARQKETQTETELDEEINQTTTNLDDELKKISKLDQKVNERKYEERRREIEQIKKKAAQEDAIKTSQVLARNLEAQMNANEVALTELEISIKEKYNFLKSGQIKDPQEIVNSERQISQAIGEKGSTKRWEKLTKRAEKLLQNSLSEKADLDQLLRDLILFSKSTNI